MQQGRGGMGSHKHGVSGYPNRSEAFKLWQRLYDAAEQRWRNEIKPRPTMYASVAEAFRRHRVR